MNMLRLIILKLKAWLKLATDLENIEAYTNGLTHDEKYLVNALLQSKVIWADIAGIILSLRDRRALKKLIKKHFPGLSDDAIEKLLEKFLGETQALGSVKNVFEQKIKPFIEAEQKNKKSIFKFK